MKVFWAVTMMSRTVSSSEPRREQRQGDVAEQLPAVGAVDHAGLVAVLGRLLQPGEQHDEALADLEQRHDHQCRQGRARVHQPSRLRQAERAQHEVQRPVERVEDPQPDQRVGDVRDRRSAGTPRRGRCRRHGGAATAAGPAPAPPTCAAAPPAARTGWSCARRSRTAGPRQDRRSSACPARPAGRGHRSR